MCAVLRSVAQSCLTTMSVAHQAPLPMGFSRQEYWSGLPCPSTGDLPNPGIEPRSPTLQENSSPSEPPGRMDGSHLMYMTVCVLSHSVLSDSLQPDER